MRLGRRNQLDDKRQAVATVKIIRRMPLPYGLSATVFEADEVRSEKEPEPERRSASS